MKVFEILDTDRALSVDLKMNKGKAVAAIVRGAKRKSNASNKGDIDAKPETMTMP